VWFTRRNFGGLARSHSDRFILRYSGGLVRPYFGESAAKEKNKTTLRIPSALWFVICDKSAFRNPKSAIEKPCAVSPAPLIIDNHSHFCNNLDILHLIVYYRTIEHTTPGKLNPKTTF
jgi:hypothetical protein